MRAREVLAVLRDVVIIVTCAPAALAAFGGLTLAVAVLGLIALGMCTPADAETLLRGSGEDVEVVEVEREELPPHGLTHADTPTPGSGHRWPIYPTPAPRPVLKPDLLVIEIDRSDADRRRHRYDGDPLWKKACRARGVYPRSCLPNATGRLRDYPKQKQGHHHPHGDRRPHDALQRSRPNPPRGVPAAPINKIELAPQREK